MATDEVKRLMEERRYPEAAKVLQALMAEYPGSAGLWIQYGRCQLATDQYEAALASFAEAIERGATALEDVMRALQAGTQIEEVTKFAKYVTMAANHPDLTQKDAGALAEMLDEEDCVDLARQVHPILLKRFPHSTVIGESDPRCHEAYALVEEGAFDQAARLARQWLDEAPENPFYLAMYGAWKYAAGEPAEALVALKGAIAQGDARYLVVGTIARACIELGRREEGAQYEVALLAYDELPEEDAATIYISHLVEEKYHRTFAEGAPAWAERYPNSAFFRFVRGFWRYMEGDLDGATADLEPLANADALLRVHLPYAYLLHDMGQDDRALAQLVMATVLQGPERHAVVLMTRFPDKFANMQELLQQVDPDGRSVNQRLTLDTSDWDVICEDCARMRPHDHSEVGRSDTSNAVAVRKGSIGDGRTFDPIFM